LRKYLLASLIGLICLSVYLFPYAVPVQSADEPTGLSNMTLWIFPEYDDPRLLVMTEGRITGITAPAQIRFLVPSAAEMYSAGSIDAQGKYSGGPPDRKASSISGWDEISYTATSNVFRIEFYDPVIPTETNKSFSYDFRSLYPISDLKVIVQVPAKATDFSVVPAGVKTAEGSFAVYTYSLVSPKVDEPLHFDISYSKSDPNPSIGTATPSAGDSVPANKLNILWPVLGIVGLLLIVILVLWLIKTRNKINPVKSASVVSSKNTKQRSKFCSQCGKRLDYPSKYCPYCRNKIE
jgi:hypothetical protein